MNVLAVLVRRHACTCGRDCAALAFHTCSLFMPCSNDISRSPSLSSPKMHNHRTLKDETITMTPQLFSLHPYTDANRTSIVSTTRASPQPNQRNPLPAIKRRLRNTPSRIIMAWIAGLLFSLCCAVLLIFFAVTRSWPEHTDPFVSILLNVERESGLVD